MKELDQKNMLIGYKLRQLRTTRGYTQSKIAEFLGMSSQHYGTLERGINAFSLNNVMRLCNFYNVPVINILGDIRKSDKGRRKESERLTSQIEELGDEHKEAVTHMVKFYRQLERKIGRQSQEEMEDEMLKKIEEENELQQLAAAMQQQAEEANQKPKKTRGRKSQRVLEQEALFKLLVGEEEFNALNEPVKMKNENSISQTKKQPKKKAKKVKKEEPKEIIEKDLEKDEKQELENKEVEVKEAKPKTKRGKSKKKSSSKKKNKKK